LRDFEQRESELGDVRHEIEQEHNRLKDECSSLREAAESLNDRLAAASRESFSLRAKCEALTARCTQLEDAAATVQSELAETIAAQEQWQTDQEVQRSEFGEKIRALELERDELASHAEGRSGDEAQGDTHDQESESELTRVSAALYAAEQQRDQLARRVQDQSEEIHRLEAILSTPPAATSDDGSPQLDELKRQLRAAHTEVDELRTLINNLGITVT